MIRSRKILAIIIAFTLFSCLSCQDEKGSSMLPFFSSNNSETTTDDSDGATDTDSKYYTEPAGDDSCSGCPGQLSDTAAAQLKSELAKNNIMGAKIDLNVRVTIPKSVNPYSDRDLDLWATVIRPGGSEKLPTILVATPYRRDMMMMLYVPLVLSRYNLMCVDIRGTGSSEGKWQSFDLVEQYDIKHVVDAFIPSRVWSNGTVGMIGPSYMGIIQLLTAGLVEIDPVTKEPVHLKAIFPIVPMSDAYRDIVMHGGNCDLLFIPLWLGMVDIMAIMPSLLNLGVDGTLTREDAADAQAMWLEHWNHITTTIGWIMDADNMNKTPFYEKKSTMIYWPQKPVSGWGFPEGQRTLSSKLPAFCVGGWFDIFTRGTTNVYAHGLKNHSTSDKRMIIGEWYHLSGAMGMGLNSIMTNQLPARWFDWKIKKKKDPFMEEFPVMLYVMGERKWRAEKSWPLPESRVDHKTMYLTKNAPTPIDGDWYSDDQTLLKIYRNNNFGLSEVQDFSGDNPVLKHDVVSLYQGLNLHGGNSRASVRWLMGMEAIISDISKFYLGQNIDAAQWYDDERHDEKECLTFTSEPLADDLEIVGPLTLTFWARTKFADPVTQAAITGAMDLIKDTFNVDTNLITDSMSKKDVQWISELNDVFPDGRARNITSGWLSAWHRPYDPSGKTATCTLDGKQVTEHALDPAYVPFDPFYSGPDKNPRVINEGELYQYTVELWPTCNVFKAGHRIRVSLSGSDFPHLLPIIQPSNNTIVIDAKHSAQIDFTAANGDNEGATWEWIGSNADADKYLLSGGALGCGTAASAASHRGTVAGLIAEVMGLMGIMMLPMSLIMMQRHIRRKMKA